jgi:hypothetical protein
MKLSREKYEINEALSTKSPKEPIIKWNLEAGYSSLVVEHTWPGRIIALLGLKRQVWQGSCVPYFARLGHRFIRDLHQLWWLILAQD